MGAENPRGALHRVIVPNQHSRVTYAELFFDLVFVYAVTQVSHLLLARFTVIGAVETTLLFLAVWWVWVFTTWVTNWLDPELTPVRILLFLLMLLVAAPFFGLSGGVGGFISLFIIFIGLKQAWTLTARGEVLVVGPYEAAPPA